MPDEVEVSWVFHQIERRIPQPQITWSRDGLLEGEREHVAWENTIRNSIADALTATGDLALLVKRGGETARLSASDLRWAIASRLRVGIFDPLDYHLDGWRDWHGARVVVLRGCAVSAIRLALEGLRPKEGNQVGRPERVPRGQIAKDYAARFPDGHAASGLSWKDAHRSCPSAASVSLDTFKRAVGRRQAKPPA